MYGKAPHVAIESDMVLVGGNTAIDRLGVGRRNLELGCQSKSAKVCVRVCACVRSSQHCSMCILKNGWLVVFRIVCIKHEDQTC